MNIQFTLASRYLAGRKLRSFLTTLAIIFGVMVVFGLNTMLPTMIGAFQASMLAASDQVDLTISHRTGEVFSPDLVDAIAGLEGIRASHGFLARSLNLPADYFDNDPAVVDRFTILSLIGLDPDAAQRVRGYPIEAGRFLQTGDEAAAVISASLADVLGLEVGDTLALPTAEGLVELTLVGIRPPRSLPGNEEVIVPLPEAQAMLNNAGLINTIEANFDTTDETRRTAIEQSVRQRLGADFSLGTLSTTTDMFATLQAAQIGFSLFGIMALFMGAFIIFNTFRTIVVERRRDIGMLRAVGASRRTIIGIILVEGLLQGTAGTLLGMALGYSLAAGGMGALAPMMQNLIRMNISWPVITPGIVVGSLVMGIGFTLLAGLLPAIAAGRVSPLDALRPSVADVSYRRTLTRSAIVGIVFIVAAVAALFSSNLGLVAFGAILFLLGLVLVAPALVRPLALVFSRLLGLFVRQPGVGTLAQGNLTRQPGRAAVTASTTMIALAIIIAMGGMVTSVTDGFMGILEESLGSDYLFVPPAISVWQNNVGANATLVERLKQIEGVGPISTFRYAAAVADIKPAFSKGAPKESGITIALLGIDPITFPQVSGLAFDEGSADAAYAQLAQGRAIILNPPFAAASGLKPGDTLPLLAAEGRFDYTVVAVAGDFMNAKINTAYISQVYLAADFHKTEDIFIQLNLLPSADAEAVSKAMAEIRADFPQFTIVEGQAYYKEMVGLFQVAFSGIYILFAFLAAPSLIAMLNTLAIGVLERTREIGMLRAVGSTNRQVRSMVLAEALLLAAFGTAFGLLAGIYLGYLLIGAMGAIGFPMRYIFPYIGIFAAVTIGLLFGALAAIIPARQAAKLEIVAALRYE